MREQRDESTGEYPELFEWPTDDRSIEYASDSPRRTIPSSQSLYRDEMERALEANSNEESRLSQEEEYELAEIIQLGLAAEETLSSAEALSSEEAERCEAQIRAGKDAQEVLVLGNLKLASYLARASMNALNTTRGKGWRRSIGVFRDIRENKSYAAELEDRIQYANEGLIDASKKYLPTVSDKTGRPPKFATYAIYQIQRMLERGIEKTEHNGVRLPANVEEEIRGALRHPEKFTSETLALHGIYKLRQSRLSLETVFATQTEDVSDTEWDERRPLATSEIVSSYEPTDPVIRRIDDALPSGEFHATLQTILSEREYDIVKERFGFFGAEPKTLTEIADGYGFSRERARQIESAAFKKLRGRTVMKEYTEYFSEAFSPEPQHTLPAITAAVRNIDSRAVLPFELDADPSEIERKYLIDDIDQPDRPENPEPEDFTDEEVRNLLRNILYAAPRDSFEQNGTDDYPIELVEMMHDATHNGITAVQLETFLNVTINRYGLAVGDLNNFKLDRRKLGLFLSHLMRDVMLDEDVIEMNVSRKHDGVLPYLGYGLDKGTLIINGNVGAFTGANMSGVARIVVNGNVGSNAAVNARDFATLTVNGNVGYDFGKNAADMTDLSYAGSAKTRKIVIKSIHVPTVARTKPERESSSAQRAERMTADNMDQKLYDAHIALSSIRARLLAERGMLESLGSLGDRAYQPQVIEIENRIDDLMKQRVIAERRRYKYNRRARDMQKGL